MESLSPRFVAGSENPGGVPQYQPSDASVMVLVEAGDVCACPSDQQLLLASADIAATLPLESIEMLISEEKVMVSADCEDCKEAQQPSKPFRRAYDLTGLLVFGSFSVGVLSISIITIVNILAIAQGHVDLWPFAFISSAAGHTPQSAVFGVGMSICAFIISILMCISFWTYRTRCYLLESCRTAEYIQESESKQPFPVAEQSNPSSQLQKSPRPWPSILITLFLVTGLISALSLMTLSLLPAPTYGKFHDSITGVFFFMEVFHVSITCILDLSYAIRIRKIKAFDSFKRVVSKQILCVRLVIFGLMFCSAVGFLFFWALRSLHTTWRSLAAIMEYIFVATVLSFHMTFVMDFRRLKINVSIELKVE